MSGRVTRAARVTCLTAATRAAVSLLPPVAAAQTPDHQAARAAVERFLEVLGNRQVDQLPALFAPKATMVVVRQREGQWSHTTSTVDEFLATLKAQANPTTFKEPLTNVSVHVEDGQLAFVRADFTVVIDGQVRSHGVDYFTLVKDGGAWKMLNASYTSKTGAPVK
jgi:ketosteroid isomerase-like protein